MPLGDFDAATAWSIETWGGNPDLSFFLDSWHSDYVAKPGDRQTPAQLAALEQPGARRDHRDDAHHQFNDHEANVELGDEFIKLMVEEMPVIPIMSFNVFSAYDTRYWTGLPTAEDQSIRQHRPQLVELEVHRDPVEAGERERRQQLI